MRMRRGAVGAFAVVSLLLVAAGSATSASTTAHATPRWRATRATWPAHPAVPSFISSISCASPGYCTAVGGPGGAALLFTETAGRWAPGVEAVLPPNAPNAEFANVTSVSCASPGNCTAVGDYGYYGGGRPDDGAEWGLLLTETDGQWAPGVQAGDVVLNSVSCASPGNCTAVGYNGAEAYNGYNTGLLLTQKAGQWDNGVEAPVPANANAGQSAYLTSVSCSTDGGCSAVGWYASKDNHHTHGLLLTKEGGTWHAAQAVMPPDRTREGAELTSVSCVSAGNCSAIGSYNIDNSYSGALPEGVLLIERAGKWRRGVMARPPENAWGKYVRLDAISCASPGNCGAIGDYESGGGTRERLTLLTETAGKWGGGVQAVLPRGAHHPDGRAISCASPGNCTAVGWYGNVTQNAFDNRYARGILLTETDGRWARAVIAPHRSGAYGPVVSVSCASPGRCGAAGGLLLDSSTH
jgi:hypothetical protein